MNEKKAFLLRLDPSVWAQLERLARTELRSVNAQIEFLLRDALSRRGISLHRRSGEPSRGSRESTRGRR